MAPKDHVPSFSGKELPENSREKLQRMVAPHIESFNYFLDTGLQEAVADIPPVELKLGETGPHVRIWITDANVGYPSRRDDSLDSKMLPRECRERGQLYSGHLNGTIAYQVDDGPVAKLPKRLGDLPIMVRSNRCWLNDMSEHDLVKAREEATELGGYFIVNGIERVIRLLQVPRRNYCMAIERGTFKNRGPAYSDKGVTMRCARPDQSTITITLHYLSSGGATLRFALRKQEFLLPVVLIAKSLKDISDKEIYDRVLQGDKDNTFISARLELLLRDFKKWGLKTRLQCLQFLGSRFRNQLPISDRITDLEAGRMLIDRYIFVHVRDHADKLEALMHMLRKLYALVQGRCRPDNADSLMNQEILLPGHLVGMYVKEKMEELLLAMRTQIMRDGTQDLGRTVANFSTTKYMMRLVERYGSTMARKVVTFLSTGNIVSSTGLDLMQVSGYTIVAERLNYFRFLSHFQSVHRGQYFTQMKTTAVRKLLPESWGFLCPVHTPDGSPCGLLNHLATECRILSTTNTSNTFRDLPALLVSLGVTPAGSGGGDGRTILTNQYLPVLLDGRVVGGAPAEICKQIDKALRELKTQAAPIIDPSLEVAFIPPLASESGTYPGLFLFTGAARMIRPVQQLKSQRLEWIGPLEQVFMEVACLPDDIRSDTTHIELDPTNMLSHIASLTPFSDYNQSPRNMYQCQMGKQSMGTPAHALAHRSDNKLYRLLFPQAPIVQTRRYREYMMDQYSQGMNAVVAVISYTGYDMEDAMILNKSSYERGFGHGCVYKTKLVDLMEDQRGNKAKLRFSNTNPTDPNVKLVDKLDEDGLPIVGEWVKPGEPLYSFLDETTGQTKVINHKDTEEACIEAVRVLGSDSQTHAGITRITIALRFRRNPIIGDKFSSRHGQKGVLSILWPQEDMPFTESGMSPDVIINPHAFPSRMTIGMLIESMAGKSGALHGMYQDATPFRFHEGQRAIDYFGEQLRASGYAYYGSEPLYSGVHGTVLHADIFIGVVYYQRLRHMVSDKSQVRSTGAVNSLTRQPVKGRKRHGGIRLGEMERDALLSHGISFCVHDRLMNSSDRHVGYVCNKCGNLISVHTRRSVTHSAGMTAQQSAVQHTRGRNYCRMCDDDSHIEAVALPYVYRYLVNELAAMGIKLKLKLRV